MIDYTLNPLIIAFRRKVDKLKEEFDQDLTNKIFSKTFNSYFQEQVKNTSDILLPTPVAFSFYKTLCNKVTLREKIVKFYISKKLLSLQLEDNFDKATQLLQNYRHCQLVKLMKPGALSAFLERKGLLSKERVVPNNKKTSAKKVRFA